MNRQTDGYQLSVRFWPSMSCFGTFIKYRWVGGLGALPGFALLPLFMSIWYAFWVFKEFSREYSTTIAINDQISIGGDLLKTNPAENTTKKT